MKINFLILCSYKLLCITAIDTGSVLLTSKYLIFDVI